MATAFAPLEPMFPSVVERGGMCTEAEFGSPLIIIKKLDVHHLSHLIMVMRCNDDQNISELGNTWNERRICPAMTTLPPAQPLCIGRSDLCLKGETPRAMVQWSHEPSGRSHSVADGPNNIE